MNDDEMPEGWPNEPNKESGEPGRITRIETRARRAVAAARAALAELSQSRGIFAVIGAAVATAIFVLFSSLPGGNSLLKPPPASTDRTENVDPGAGISTGNGAAPTGPDRDPLADRSVPPAAPPAPPEGSPAGEPAPAEPLPAQQAEAPAAPVQPVPRDPTPEQPTPRTPSAPGVLQDKIVRMSTQAGQDSVGIDWWRKRNSESHDLRMDHNGLITMLGAALSVIADPHGTVDYHDCAQRTTWVTQVDFTTLHPGSTLCARSHSGRYATLTVIALPQPAKPDSGFVFHARTWRLPGRQQPSPRHTPPQTPSSAPSTQSMPAQRGK